MIRFSAALVVVAVAVLIGGVVTSTLLLVYVAIILSAAALIALAIGVAVKRDELFGGTGHPVGDVMGSAGHSAFSRQSGAQPIGGMLRPGQGYGDQPGQGYGGSYGSSGDSGYGGTAAAGYGNTAGGTPTPAAATPSTSAERSAPLPGAAKRAVTQTRADLTALGEDSPSAATRQQADSDETRMDLPPVRPEERVRPEEKPSGGLPRSVTETRFDLKPVLDDAGQPGQVVPSTPVPGGTGFPGGTTASASPAPPSTGPETRADMPAISEPVGRGPAGSGAPSAGRGPETRFDLPAQPDTPSQPPWGESLVAVIPGVPRYHAPNCILIRFMDDEDLEKKTLDEAKAAGCTPCTACQAD